MKKSIYILLFWSSLFYGQVSTKTNIWFAKEFSKDVAIFRAKTFLYKDVLSISENIEKFELIPLAASSSGELTTLIYKSESKNKEGLVLGFFGDYWNDSGVIYQGYKFKDLSKIEAVEFLEKIDNAIKENEKFLKENDNKNNIYFSYKDIDVLISSVNGDYIIRLYWDKFDSRWDKTAFDRSKRRFEKNFKK